MAFDNTVESVTIDAFPTGCLGCGGRTADRSYLCNRCHELLQVGLQYQPSATCNKKNLSQGNSSMREESLISFVQRGLFFKSILLSVIVFGIVLFHPTITLLGQGAHQVCAWTGKHSSSETN